MSMIKDQLLTLDVASKMQKTIVDPNADLAELLSEKLIDSIINKKSLNKFYSCLNDYQCRLPPAIKKKVKNKHQKAINSNSLDIVSLNNFIKSIDLESAKKKIIEHKKKKLVRQCKPKLNKRREAKPYKAPKPRKISVKDKIEQLKATPTIGLGVESSLKIPKVKSSEVVIDKNTINHYIRDKSILYAAGWSLAKDNDSDWI